MNLHLLRIYHSVVEHQGFSRAATVLGISQPAVSKAVRELESQLETVLLERNGKQFRVSDPGQVLYDYACGIFSMEQAAVEAVQAYADMGRGTLKIGASTTIAAYWLPKYIAEFTHKHPGVKISLASGNTQHVAQWLLDCDVDVALVEGPIEDERLEMRSWREEEMVIVVPRNSPLMKKKNIAAGALGEPLWILREHGSGSREVVERELMKLNVIPQATLEMGSNEAIVQTVAQGAGIGMVPRVCAQDQIELGRVAALKLESGAITRKLFRLRLPRRPVSQAAIAFEALIATGA
ncbi:MAG TPA: LysR family transcriptional regulator [Rhodocyclaceae bacterium]|nr:LysR family transcriptional regulator [Rhodocyclaceae bacterium]